MKQNTKKQKTEVTTFSAHSHIFIMPEHCNRNPLQYYHKHFLPTYFFGISVDLFLDTNYKDSCKKLLWFFTEDTVL